MGMGRPQPDVALVAPGAATLPDAEIVSRILAGERALFEILMRRHNQQLYRAARAVVNDEAEVEDIMQQAYFNAFRHLHQFEERARFSTWMTRIVLNEAFARRKKRQQLHAPPITSPMATTMGRSWRRRHPSRTRSGRRTRGTSARARRRR